MASKRDLKKFIRNTCGALASEIILAKVAFPVVDGKKVYDIVTKVAALQSSTISKVSVNFDKALRDFAEKAEYNKERRAYYRTAYDNLLSDFDKAVDEIIKEMNSALPEEVRQTLKEAAAE
ncbi:MAG: hypothetical protein J1F05_06895 [Muribaculaceae bacterium]|nr:hypothetical protein [Muribaculaceae bacterium]